MRRHTSGRDVRTRVAILLGLLFFLSAGCRRAPPSGSGASEKPAQEQPRTIPAPVVTPVVKRNPLPPDGQIMRDLEPRMRCEMFELQERVQNVDIKAKVLDRYEHDAAGVVVIVKVAHGEAIRYTLGYRWRGSFWRLVSLESEGAKSGIPISHRCQ